MRKQEIRNLKVGDQLAVRFELTVTDEHMNAVLVRDASGRIVRKSETNWMPAKVVEIEEQDGTRFPRFEGTTEAARGFIKHFHSGYVDEYSFQTIERMKESKS